MSGGSYDYRYRVIDELADEIRSRGGCPDYCASPALRAAFRVHLRAVAAACKAIEWNDSSDGAADEIALIRACLAPGAVVARAIEDTERAIAALSDELRALIPTHAGPSDVSMQTPHVNPSLIPDSTDPTRA